MACLDLDGVTLAWLIKWPCSDLDRHVGVAACLVDITIGRAPLYTHRITGHLCCRRGRCKIVRAGRPVAQCLISDDATARVDC